tara:strand:- start:1260 stop:1688 length:429 start_codon:yes stop_codon:yes gene_type:complete
MSEKGNTLTPVRFRPHHFLCANGFQGKGYSSSFVENFSAIVDRLRGPAGGEIPFVIVEETDDICHPCPHRRGKKCSKQILIDSLDKRHASVLDLKVGQKLTWGEAQQKIIKYVTDDIFQEICHGCFWQKEGMCLKALRNLRP